MFQFSPQDISWTLVLICLSLVVFRAARIGRRESGLPPGPPTIPIFGNATLIPTEHSYFRFTDWARQYGGIYSLKILSNTMIVLTDPAAVHELLDKRSASSSDRTSMFFADLVTDGLHLAFARHDRLWKLLRRCVNDILSPTESAKHLPIQNAETAQLLYDLLKTPEDFYRHAARFTNSIIMSVVFRTRSPRYQTQHSNDFYEMFNRWSALLAPGTHPPVDLIPGLRYVPERWASWKSECREIRQMQRNLYFDLLSRAQGRIDRGEENGSFVESLLRRQDESQLNREKIGYLGGTLIEAGSETAMSFLRSVILALVEHPEALRKAQKEIDHVVGNARLPQLEDAVHLPYIQAIVKETYRFRPMAPLAVPHALVSDEMYQGYHFPKGANLLINVWGIFHDPGLFEKPNTFWPDRYILSEHGTKPGYEGTQPRSSLAFGAGRRICPGMHLANNTLLLAVSNLIWAFDFERPLDSTGQPILQDLNDYSEGISSGPNPFKCRIIPRSPEKAVLIEANFAAAIETLARFETGLDPSERLDLKIYQQ